MPTTHIAVLLDETGSMMPLRASTVSSVNEYFSGMKPKVEKGKPIKATLVTFNSMKHHTVYENVKVQEVEPLTYDGYQPDHMTPLYDSLARMMRATDPKVKKDDRVLMVIVTDGQENYSRETKLKDIQDMIRERTDQGNWTFVYIGAHADAWDESASMGIPHANTIQIPHDPQAVKTTSRALAGQTMSYYAGSSASTGTFWDPSITGIDPNADEDATEAKPKVKPKTTSKTT